MRLSELLDEGLFRQAPPKKKPVTRIATSARATHVVDNRTDAELERDVLRAKKLKAQGASDVNRGEDRSPSQDWTFG